MIALLLLVLAFRPAAYFILSVVYLVAPHTSAAAAHVVTAVFSQLSITNARLVVTTTAAWYGMLSTTAAAWLAWAAVALIRLPANCQQLISTSANQQRANVLGCILFFVVLVSRGWDVCSSLQAMVVAGCNYLSSAIALCYQATISCFQPAVRSCQVIASMAAAVLLSEPWRDYMVTMIVLAVAWVGIVLPCSRHMYLVAFHFFTCLSSGPHASFTRLMQPFTRLPVLSAAIRVLQQPVLHCMQPSAIKQDAIMSQADHQ